LTEEKFKEDILQMFIPKPI